MEVEPLSLLVATHPHPIALGTVWGQHQTVGQSS